MPTAVQMIAAMPSAKVGSSFDLAFRNEDADYKTTMACSVGVTIQGTTSGGVGVGSTAVLKQSTRLYRGVVTAAATVTLYEIGSMSL
jgi:hypothetical protein